MSSPQAEPPAEATSAFAVVVTAAGIGSRMGNVAKKKPYLQLCGRPILEHTLHVFRALEACAQVVVVVHPDEYGDAQRAANLRKQLGVDAVVAGGRIRQESALAGLEATQEADVVLIHDAVRPLVSPRVVHQVAGQAQKHGAAIAAAHAVHTIKRARPGHVIDETLPRTEIWYAHTPQGFRRDLILRAHHSARKAGFVGTDDAQLVERLGVPVHLVPDSRYNLKITTREDLAVAEALLSRRAAPTSAVDRC